MQVRNCKCQQKETNEPHLAMGLCHCIGGGSSDRKSWAEQKSSHTVKSGTDGLSGIANRSEKKKAKPIALTLVTNHYHNNVFSVAC